MNTETAKNRSTEIDNNNGLAKSPYRLSIAKKAYTVVSAFIPMLAVPYLYFVGRLYDLTYYKTLGIPIGIVSNEMVDTLLTGFIYGIVVAISNLMTFFSDWVIYLLAIFYISFLFIFLPQIWLKITTLISTPFKKTAKHFGKKKSLKYLETVENKLNTSTWLAQTWLFLELVLIISFLFLAILWPAQNATDNAKEDAIKFITTANKTDCLKAYSKGCQSFATITLKMTPVDQTTKKSKATRKLSGFIANSSIKEWAIYQPPQTSAEKIGQMVIIKRLDIVEIHHPIQLSALIESLDSK